MHFLLEPPPEFQGLRRDLPVTMYRRDLPHWRQDGATYFATFRLHDSLPRQALDELRAIRDAWKAEHAMQDGDADSEDMCRRLSAREEHWLDQGHGSCMLAHSRIRMTLATILLEKEIDSTAIHAYVIMPNHVLCGAPHNA